MLWYKFYNYSSNFKLNQISLFAKSKLLKKEISHRFKIIIYKLIDNLTIHFLS